MIDYELIPVCSMPTCVRVTSTELPEVVHLDDPAVFVMIDYNFRSPDSLNENVSMDDALSDMKFRGVHVMLVVNDAHCVVGVLSRDDLLGEKPITLIQTRRIERSQVVVSMLMTPVEQVPFFNIDDIKLARVGNMVSTLRSIKRHDALVINQQGDNPTICGLFHVSQINKQLHYDMMKESK